MPRLENWSVVQGFNMSHDHDKYGYLQGIVFDHGHIEDGTHTLTSAIVSFNIAKGLAKTYSGSLYSLGKPDSEWVQWLKDNNHYQIVKDIEKLQSTLFN